MRKMRSHSFHLLRVAKLEQSDSKAIIEPLDDVGEFNSQITIDSRPLNLDKLNAQIQVNDGTNGASVVFTGSVRAAMDNKNLVGMTLEHYPGMTENQLNLIVHNAAERWRLNKVLVVHRIGHLTLGEPIVFVGVSAAHRIQAFEGAQFIMDYLKNEATFWKKEHYQTDSLVSEEWVEAKQSDIDSLKKWQEN